MFYTWLFGFFFIIIIKYYHYYYFTYICMYIFFFFWRETHETWPLDSKIRSPRPRDGPRPADGRSDGRVGGRVGRSGAVVAAVGMRRVSCFSNFTFQCHLATALAPPPDTTHTRAAKKRIFQKNIIF